METRLWAIGDRVALQQPFFSVPTGAVGTIVHIYQSNADFCRVRFDQDAGTYPIPYDRLERLEQVTSERARGVNPRSMLGYS
jgi:hypothetical protein